MKYLIKLNEHNWRTTTVNEQQHFVTATLLLHQAEEIWKESGSMIGGYHCIKSTCGNADKLMTDKEALIFQLQATPFDFNKFNMVRKQPGWCKGI
jgi:hypothetical protein